MKDWITKLDEFLKLGGRKLLGNAGSVSKSKADKKALGEYEKYRELSDGELSDIEKRFLENIKKTQKQLEKKPPERTDP
jgi:hypothetical protein